MISLAFLYQLSRRPSFRKRQPTVNGGAVPLPERVDVYKTKPAHKTVRCEDGFSEGDAGFLAHEDDGALSGMISHLAQMAMDAETPEEFNAILKSLHCV